MGFTTVLNDKKSRYTIQKPIGIYYITLNDLIKLQKVIIERSTLKNAFKDIDDLKILHELTVHVGKSKLIKA